MRIWHHRHAGPLLTLWGVAVAIAAGLYWMENDQPALREMIDPLYYIILIVMLFRPEGLIPSRRRAAELHEGVHDEPLYDHEVAGA